MLNYNRTCLYRFIGQCKNCEIDYEEHHPNNLDCPRYKEVPIFNVKPLRVTSTIENKLK